MKESEYNEIDRLLRNLAGRQRSISGDLAGANLSGPGAHLDADELNSYAEGALPASTRARYTSHLADCDDCRRIVTQLSIAAGSVSKEGKGTEEAAISRWRRILPTLFTPVVLRYAMPALALVVVVTFAFLAWRQREVSFVAVNKQAEAPSTAQPTSDVSRENSRVDANAPSERQQKTAQPQSSSTPTASDKVTATADEKKADAAPSSSAAASSKEKDAPRNEAVAVTQPSYAPELAAAPPPKPTTTAIAKSPAKAGEDRTETRDTAIGGRKESDKARGSGAVTASGTATAQPRAREKTKALDDGRAAADRRADEAGRRADEESESRTADRRAAEESESRTVNGRRFQRRNGAWVDAAYNSSTATTNVARGSEQYRALIADEPGIDSIAKQLSGEVILVWKGRAYRIH